MDDERTKEALDALADLFLTGISPEEGAAARRTNDPLAGPTPIRLKPKVAAPASEDAAAEVDSTDESLPGPDSEQEMLEAVTGSHAPTPLQLGEQPFLRLADQADEYHAAVAKPEVKEPTDQQTESKPATALVEAVLLGNLPGVSGPWLQQYAQVLADQDGPVVMLHVGGERIDLELIEPRDSAGQTHPVIEMGREADPRPAVVTLLDSLVRSEDSPVTTVLVHVEPAVDGSEALRLFAIDDWTLLCGADDAAVVGAQQMLQERIETDVTVQEKRVGLMVMGADQAASRAAASRVKTAADSFLETPVTLVGWQKQMIPVHVRQLGTFEGVGAIWPKLCDWFASLEPPAFEEAPETLSHATQPSASPPPEEPAPAIEEALEKVVEQSAADEPVIETPTPAVTQARSAVMDIPTPRPKPQPAAQARKPVPQAQPAPALAEVAASDPLLSELIDTLPGSVALEARCPHLHETEIVLDQDGILHLLARHDADDLEQVITQLYTARQWVIEHRQLIALTQRQLKLDDQIVPALHLFTGRADLATKLVARLGDQLKLHLLQPITVGDQSTWFTTPLN